MSGPIADANWSDEDLVRECLEGNQTAWAALVEKYKRLVYSMPQKYQLPPEEAADVFQGVWTDLYRDLSKIERVAGLRAWLITAAARRCLLHKKRRQNTTDLGDVGASLSDPSPDPAAILEGAEREQKLREAIVSLPERCRQMVEMLFFEDPPRPYSEVAESLGLAEGSIGFIRGRCLAKLRKLLEEAGW